MKTQFNIPDFKNLLDQFNELQAKNIEAFQKTADVFMAGINPMEMLFSGKTHDNNEGFANLHIFSEITDFMKNATQNIMDISHILLEDTESDETIDAENRLKKQFSDLPITVFKKLIEIPPVGLTRPYQEKINMALDKMAMFHSAITDFLHCTFLPVEETTLFTFKEIAKKTAGLKTPEDVQKAYEFWLKTLEEEYQELFKTDRYTKVVAKAFSSMGEFRGAYRELILDLLKLAGLPFGREVDEISKDMFVMKKKMKEFEAQLKKIAEQKES